MILLHDLLLGGLHNSVLNYFIHISELVWQDLPKNCRHGQDPAPESSPLSQKLMSKSWNTCLQGWTFVTVVRQSGHVDLCYGSHKSTFFPIKEYSDSTCQCARISSRSVFHDAGRCKSDRGALSRADCQSAADAD